jgi:hypothetical protein
MCSLLSFCPKLVLGPIPNQRKEWVVLDTFFNSLEVGRSKSAEMLLTVAFPFP